MVELRADESNSFNVCRVESYDLWHARLGRQGKNYINNVLKNHNINFSAKDYFCEGCIFGKQTRFSFEESIKRATNIGDLVHSDVCGPMEVESVGGSKFFVIFKDDYSKYRVIYPISSKSTVIEKFKDFCAKLKKETGKSVVRLRTDNGTEYVNKFFSDFMNCNNIINETSVPYTPEQNGRAEREMRTIVEMARTMIHSKNLNVNLWAEAVNTAVYIINRTYINDNNGKSPYEIWFNEVPDISYFLVFGSYVYCHVPKVKRQKWDSKSRKGIFVGYGEYTKGYRVFFPDTFKVEIHRDVIFSNELKKNDKEEIDSMQEDFVRFSNIKECEQQIVNRGESLTGTDVSVNDSMNDSVGEIFNSFTTDDSDETTVPINSEEIIRRSGYNLRSKDKINCFICVAVCEEPKTFADAISSRNSKDWKLAINDEFDSLVLNKTWYLVSMTG